MPQMAPISWLSLFLIFTMSFIMFNMMNYYCLNPILKNNLNFLKVNYKSMNWKW
nr:ATP synthase F0 subunit 8 [Cephalops aeneus]